METFLIKALQLILSLSILVIVHEFGHFIFARIFKIRVEKFYLFFDAGFSLFKFKPKNSDTEYGIGWLPLGGYVKLAGMMDESMDKEQLAQPPKPWEFRTKPAWQRLLVMLGGVMFNLILAIFILSMMVFAWGDTYIPYKNIKTGMEFSEVAKKIGFKDKDILISADGKELQMRGSVLEINTMMDFLDAKEVTVERDGKITSIWLPDYFADEVIASKEPVYTIWIPTLVDSLREGSEAQRIGLQKGDSLIALNGNSTGSFFNFKKELAKHKNDSVEITYSRNGQENKITALVDTAGTLGFYLMAPQGYKMQTDQYGFFASFPVGVTKGIETLKGYVSQSRFIFSKEGVKNLSGFAGIGKMFPAQWNWEQFWTMTAFLSIILAFMNILPIPMLDGGHIMFLLYEIIARRKPNEKFQAYAQNVGLFLLLALLLIANGNDLLRAIFG